MYCVNDHRNAAVTVWLLAAAALLVVSGGCTVHQFDHYEPPCSRPPASAYTETDLSATGGAVSQGEILFTPLGLRTDHGGVVVDVLVQGAGAATMFSGDMWDDKPSAVFWVLIGPTVAEVQVAGLPRRVVDKTDIAALGSTIDPGLVAVYLTTPSPADPGSRIVSIPVVPNQPLSSGDTCWVELLLHHDGRDSRVLSNLPADVRARSAAPRMLRVTGS